MHREWLEKPGNMLHPLTLYLDKTGVDKMQKNSLEPLAATSSILSASSKQDCSNWFVIGYIPNLDGVSSNAMRDYHRCLSSLLEPLRHLQENPGQFLVRRGSKVARMTLRLPISTVVGDNLSSNKLCGKVENKTTTSVRMSRRCLTSHDSSDECPHHCHPVHPQLIHALSLVALKRNKEQLVAHFSSLTKSDEQIACRLLQKAQKLSHDLLWQVLGSHPLENAFHQMDMGACSSIHSATVADIMHTLEEGIIPIVIHCLIDPLTDSKKKELDDLVAKLLGSSSQVNKSGDST